ncbi:MAG: hypothetical protein GXO48_06800 [Chlorobi bacterium]|nr:hypothetical protein [Chlorobiota bacterium]
MKRVTEKMLLLLMGIGVVNMEAQKVGVGTTQPQAALHVSHQSVLIYPALMNTIDGDTVFMVSSDKRVGVGTGSPTQRLHVKGNVMLEGALMPSGNAGNSGQVLISQGSNVPPMWVDPLSIGDNWGSQVAVTISPVVGDGTTTNPITLQSGNNVGDVLVWDGTQWLIQQPGSSSGIASLCNNPSINMVQKWTGADLCNSIIYDDGTNVGIGITTPGEKLDVAGNIQFSGALMPGGSAGSVGQVLVSQGPGVAPQWRNATSVGGDNWGSQVAQTSTPIVGDGTSSNPISIQSGTANGDLLIWNGSSWQIGQPSPSNGISPICSAPATNIIQKWTGSRLCNSKIYDNGTSIGINTTTPSPSAILDINSTNQGVLFPRVTLNAANNPAPVTSPATGLMVYNTATAGTGNNAVSPGYYYWDGSRWTRLQTNAYAGAIFGVHHGNNSYVMTTQWTDWECTGAYIDLPEGKWIVYITEIIRFHSGGSSAIAPCAVWVRTTLGDGTCTQGTVSTGSPTSLDIIGSKLASGAIGNDFPFSLVTGQIIIANKSGGVKRYSLWAQYEPSPTCPSFSASDGLDRFAGPWGENQLFAIPAQ